MVSTAVAFSVMMVTVRSCRHQFSLQISFYCLICISFCSGTQFHTCLCKSSLGSSADAAADQHIYFLLRQESCQCAMSYAIRTDHFTGNDLIIFHFIYLERLGSSKMLKYVSIIISHCYFHI